MLTISFENHSFLGELKGMIGFTNSDPHLFHSWETEQNETFIFARKRIV